MPSSWLEILAANFAPFAEMPDDKKSRLTADIRIFIAEKEWEGCGGLELTDEMRVTIAAHACRLVLGLDIDYYRQVLTILVYPTGFETPTTVPILPGLALEGGKNDTLGQTMHRGPVLLSWKEFYDDFNNPGRGKNLVYHEFAHKIDMLNGAADGVPPIDDVNLVNRWLHVLPAELNRLRRDSETGRPTLLDPYGATNEAEFFAVASECFFDLPHEMKNQHPRLYDLWREFYRQDPAGTA